MDFLLSQELDLPTAGEIRKGVVVQHSDNFILVDLGAKSEGIIIGDELAALDSDAREELSVGSEVDVFILETEDSSGNIVLSYTKAVQERDWDRAAKLLKSMVLKDCIHIRCLNLKIR